MDKSVLQIIVKHVPEADIIESGDGAYKIRLPYCFNEMAAYRELRRALKESPAKPICSTCRSENTKFRYFDNSSSKALQARYKCLACNNLFTLGGKQYCKDHNAANGQDHQKEKKFNSKDRDQHSLVSRKKIKWKEADCSSSNIRAGDNDYSVQNVDSLNLVTGDNDYSVQNVETLNLVDFIDYFKQDAQDFVRTQLELSQKPYWGQREYAGNDKGEMITCGLSKVGSLQCMKEKEGDLQDEQNSFELQLWF